MKPKEEIKRIIVASGGNGDGIGLHLGAIVELLRYFVKQNKGLDAWVGTSAGAVVGSWIANEPTVPGAVEAREIYLGLTAGDIFGNWWNRNVIPFWRVTKTRLDINAVDSIGHSQSVKDAFRRILPSVFFDMLTIPLVATVDDIANFRFGYLDSWNTPDFPVPEAAYASSAQPPFLEPLYLDIEKMTLIDGGNAEVIPFKLALKLFTNLEEVWILAASDGSNGSGKSVHGIGNIAQAALSSRINQEIKKTLELARDPSDGIETHIIIDGKGAPSTPFFDWFDKSQEIVDAGRDNMLEYLKSPKPVMIKRI